MGSRAATGHDARQLLQLIEGVSDAENLDDYAVQVVDAVARVIPTDLAATYCEYDRVGGRVIRYAESADISAPDHVIAAFWELYHQHPLCGNRSAIAERRPLTVSDYLDRRGFQSLEVYQRYYRPLGIEHQLLVAFPTVTGRICDLAIHRATGDFTERERSVLDLLRPYLASARKVAADRARTADLERAIGDVAIATLGPGGSIDFPDTRARTWLAEYFDGHGSLNGGLPPEVASWVTRCDEPAAGGCLMPDELSISRDGQVLRLRTIPGRGPGHPPLLVLQKHARSQAPALTAAGLRLTGRERELLGWVARGLTNAQVARVMFIAPSTVHKHMEHIFAKLQVNTRTAAVARVFATPPAATAGVHTTYYQK